MRRFYALDDCGTRINPMVIEGQIHGGLTEAFAVALGQQIPFDENGNHLGNSLMDYFLPTAMETPHWETDHTVTPCPHHPIGAKGVAESPHVGGIPCFSNAVIDAFAHLGVTHMDMPHTPTASGSSAMRWASTSAEQAHDRGDRDEGRAREVVSDAGVGGGRVGAAAGHRSASPAACRARRSPSGSTPSTTRARSRSSSARRACRFAARSRCRTSTPATRTLRLLGKGTDTTGSSGASMDLTARVDAVDGATGNLVGSSEVSMSGKAATFGGRMMGTVADQVLKQFAANFAAQVAARCRRSARAAATGAVGPAPRRRLPRPPRRAAPAAARARAERPRAGLGGIQGWLRGLFGKKTHEPSRAPHERDRDAAAGAGGRRLHRRAALAAALLLMLDLGRPLLLEGDAGVGKTEVAKALAAVRGTRLIRLQCYEGLDAHSAMYEWNYQRQLLAIKLLEHDERARLRAEGAGHLLRALSAQAPAARGDQLRRSRRCC